MAYNRIDSVTAQHNGLPIDLKLQERLDVEEEPRFYCLSWRTRLPYDPTKNRQPYVDRRGGTGFWTIPVSVALGLMRQAEERGWLDGRYEDPQIRHEGTDNDIFSSRLLNPRDRRTTFESITCDEGEPDWGDDPVFIVVQVPDGRWRKIMIVDTERQVCTFRSATRDESYTKVIDCLQSPWRLDNSMQDASAAMIREFLDVLRTEV